MNREELSYIKLVIGIKRWHPEANWITKSIDGTIDSWSDEPEWHCITGAGRLAVYDWVSYEGSYYGHNLIYPFGGDSEDSLIEL